MNTCSASTILAPGGWGYAPGTPLGPVTAEMLPELPPRRLLTARDQNKAITEVLRSFPRLRDVAPRLVVERYGISSTAAWDVLQRARGLPTRSGRP